MSKEMKVVTVAVVVTITLIIVCVTVTKDGSFCSIQASKSMSAFKPIPVSQPVPNFETVSTYKAIPTFKPIPAFESIPSSTKIAVGSRNTTNEMESVLFWEFQQRNSTEDQQNFWMILASLFPSPMNFLFSLMRHRLCNNNLQQDWYREDETKQELSELKMLLQKSESLILELRDRVTFMQELEDKLHSQFQNQMDSIKIMMKVVDKSHAQLQNEVESVEDHDDTAYFQNEFDSVMPSEQVLGDPPSMMFPVEKEPVTI